MPGGATGRRLRRIRRLALASVLCHALILLAAPFEHHDLICHLKTPQHCTSCVASPAGTRADLSLSVGAARLADAGAVVPVSLASPSTGVTLRTPGRSPPAVS